MLTHTRQRKGIALHITESITRKQVSQLMLAHSTADDIIHHARLTYSSKPRWWQRGKPVNLCLFIGEVAEHHLYCIKNEHHDNTHEITITLSSYLPPEYINAFALYALGLALERMNGRSGTWMNLGSQLDLHASQTAFDMVVLSEGQRAVTDLPWRQKRAA